MTDAAHRPGPAVDVLVASRDRNFLTLARAVLRAAGHHVVTTSVRSERVCRQVRLRVPRVLLLDADPETTAIVRAEAEAAGTRVLRLTEDPGSIEEAAETPPPVGKWGPAAELLTAVDDAMYDRDPARPRRAQLRLVE